MKTTWTILKDIGSRNGAYHKILITEIKEYSELYMYKAYKPYKA